ncbi:t-SNARE [Neocallimastix californiae]|uniref:t-SNARE n=1 Tax=Neocallimastix californiae TaxID=1754190 RepID=A0A1Y2BKG2_9FUNG|nr:t-SNARE [Neocallimastix californiae]|eukprot:ORY35120.1 t-SNARE [Neocallimastix californiae]
MRDRMEEFKGTSVAPDQCSNNTNNKNSADINNYLSKIEMLKTSIAVMKQKVENLEELYNRSLDTINDYQLKQISEELNNEMDLMAKSSKDVQLQLIAMDNENKKLSGKLQPSDLRIRQTQQITLTKSFMDTMNKYRDIQTKYQMKYKERMEKQYLIVNPNTSENEIARLLESGELGTIFAQELMEKGSKSADAKAALQDIQERHQEIIKIEQTVLELQQLFIDMQVLVKDQGEVINQIECNVQSANENTEQGVEELKTAVVYQKKARKK